MGTLLALAGILGALALGAVSPGPSFLLVSHRAVAVSRRDGVAAAFGMGVGGVLFGLAALLGLQTLLLAVPRLHLLLRVVGGLYLVHLGIRLWRRPSVPAGGPGGPVEAGAGDWRASFGLALLTQLSNPKTALVYAGIFAAFLPAAPPLALLLALPPLIFVVETAWYATVAVALSSPRPRAAYLRSQKAVDRVAGTALGLLGLRFLFERARAA